MNVRWKQYPPRWGHVHLPLTSRRDALRSLTLYAPSRRRSVAMQCAAWALIAVAGPAVLPGATRSEEALSGLASPDLVRRLASDVGRVDAVAYYARPQRSRSGFGMLLLRGGRRVAFVKLNDRSLGPRREHEALEALRRLRTPTFRVPTPIALGRVDRWTYLAVEPLPHDVHGPVGRLPLTRLCAEVSQALGALPKPNDTPARWVPMHGDLTPWNVRQRRPVPRGRPFVIDWEDWTWAPPHADVVRYRAANAVLRGRSSIDWAPHEDEARNYWIARDRPAAADGDPSDMRRRMLRVLRRGAAD